ncbi:MAG: TipAS antibiotic-recognition domain-containing protein [Eggerthellaceae bacterium]|nr:TipAS antibiotic-recognition domain-containing protein [Eggerthellaceae bacterium]
MAIKDVLPQLRKDRGLTQEDLAAKLFVTRQAVSRWETGETTPGIDMSKLIASVLDVPVMQLLDLPQEESCQCCGTPFSVPNMPKGADADGTENPHYCKWCYDAGKFANETMEEVIEHSAPYLVEATGVTLDEAVSFMGALLPTLGRWKDPYEAEARQRYGDEAIDASHEKLDAMNADEWRAKNLLEESIKVQLRLAIASKSPTSAESAELARMHARWIKMHWGEGAYSREAHLGLAQGYLADERFTKYYDDACGAGATAFLVDALKANI